MFRKIAIIGGSGNVGSHIAYLGAMRGIAKEIWLYSREPQLCIGMGIDMTQAMCIMGIDSKVIGTDKYSDLQDCEVVIISAGFPRLPNMSRDDLLLKNAEIMQDVISNIVKVSPNATLIIVSNPLDIMTLSAKLMSGFDRKRVIGMAGILDSARLAYECKECGNINTDAKTLIIGEHNNSMIPLTQYSFMDKVSLESRLDSKTLSKVIDETKNGGAKLVGYYQKGSAYFAPAAGVVKVVESMIRQSSEILPCSVYLDGEYGISGVCLGVPIKLNREGVSDIVLLNLNNAQQQAMLDSAKSIQKQLEILQNAKMLKKC